MYLLRLGIFCICLVLVFFGYSLTFTSGFLFGFSSYFLGVFDYDRYAFWLIINNSYLLVYYEYENKVSAVVGVVFRLNFSFFKINKALQKIYRF